MFVFWFSLVRRGVTHGLMMSGHMQRGAIGKLCLVIARVALSFSDAKIRSGRTPRISRATHPKFKPAQSAAIRKTGALAGALPP